jgi:signal peptidase I
MVPFVSVRRLVAASVWLGLGVVALVLVVMYRPVTLGGDVRFVWVRGASMVPALEHHDLVVVRRVEEYGVGDVVVYDVATVETRSQLVVHRIVDREADGGFVTRGDNRDSTDPWRPTRAELLGRVEHVVPGGPALVGAVSSPPLRLGMAIGLGVLAGIAVLRLGGRRASAERVASGSHSADALGTTGDDGGAIRHSDVTVVTRDAVPDGERRTGKGPRDGDAHIHPTHPSEA